MSKLSDEAEAARLRAESDAAATAEADRSALRQAATAALRPVIEYVRPDGTRFTLSDSALSAVHTDLSGRLVVVSDGTVSLAVSDRDGDGTWRVVLAEDDGGWTRVSDPLTDLADLGAALTERARS